MINLRQRLIVDYSSLKSVSRILSSGQSELILVFFSLAIIFEFFGEWNFIRVLKRILICFLVLVVFDTLFKNSIDMSFGFSETLLNSCKNTEFCSHYLAAKGQTASSSLWSETTNMVQNFSSFWLHSLISLIFKCAFVFTIQIYSLIYAITSVAYPLICTMGILPSPGEKAYISLFQTLLWLFISPIMLSVVIVLLASVTEVGIGPKGEVGLEGLLHLMIISLFSLGSLFLSWLLCKGEGVAAFGSQMAQMGTTALAMAGVGGMINHGKNYGGAFREMGGMAANYGKNSAKDHVSNKVNESMVSKGMELTAHEIGYSKNSIMNSPIIPKGSEAYRSMSGGEKVFHAVDSVINARENSLAKQSMIRDFKKISSAEPSVKPTEAKMKLANYKSNARNALAPREFQKNRPQSFQNSKPQSIGQKFIRSMAENYPKSGGNRGEYLQNKSTQPNPRNNNFKTVPNNRTAPVGARTAKNATPNNNTTRV
jgi:hypothetical protein